MARNVSALAAALLGLWGSIDLYDALKRNPQRDQYRVEEMLARYEPVAAALPSDVKVIGYVSGSPYEQVRGQVMFFTAQYALAPRLLSTKPDQEWVLGDAAPAPDGFRVERDFGGGLVLYRRTR